MTSIAEQRNTRCPPRLTTPWSVSAAGHCIRGLENRPLRPTHWQEVSSRLSRDLDQLSCFLEDAEARSASIKKPSSLSDRGRNITDQAEAAGVEPTTDDHRAKEMEEDLAKEHPTDSSKTTGRDNKCGADQSLRQIPENRWQVKTRLDPTRQKPNGEVTRDYRGKNKVNKDSRGMKPFIVGSRGMKTVHMDSRGMNELNEDLRGMSKVTEDFRGINKGNEDFTGINKTKEDCGGIIEVREEFGGVNKVKEDSRGLKQIAENFRSEATSFENKSFKLTKRKGDTEKAELLPTGKKTSHVKLPQEFKAASAHATVFSADHQLADVRRPRSGENLNDRKTGPGEKLEEQKIHRRDTREAPVLNLAKALSEDDSNSSNPSRKTFKEWDAIRHQVAPSEDAYCSVAVVAETGLKSLQSSGIGESGEQTNQSWGATGKDLHRLRRGFPIQRNSRGLESGDQLPKSAHWKDVSDQWIQRVNDREEKAVIRGVACTKSTRSRPEADDKREKSKPNERLQQKPQSGEDSDERKERKTKKHEGEKKELRENDYEREKKIDNEKDEEKENKRMEKKKVGMEKEGEGEKEELIQMHNRWLGIVSEYADLLAREGNGVSKMIALRSMQSKSIQFENDYRRLATKKELSLEENSNTAADGDENDAGDVRVEEAVDKEVKALENDALRPGLEGSQPNTQQQQQLSCLHLHSTSIDQIKTTAEDVQRLRGSRSSNERPSERTSPDIQKTRSDVTLSRSPMKQVTEQDKEGYNDGYNKDVSDVGCTRSDKSVVRLSRSEKLRYLHPLRQFETNTRADQRPDGDWTTKSCRQMESIGHVDSARNATETKDAGKTPCEEEKKADEGIRSRILCEDRRPGVADNVDKNVILFALHNKLPDDGTPSELPPTAANRRGKGVSVKGHFSSCCSNRQHSNEPSLQVAGSNSCKSAGKCRSIGATRLPVSKLQTEAAASRDGSKVTTVFGDASPATETEEPSSTFPPGILRSDHPTATPSVARPGNNNSFTGPKESSQINGRPRTQDSQPDNKDSYDQRSWSDRRLAVRLYQWKRKMSAIVAEAENRIEDVIKNRETEGNAVHLMNGTENNMVRSENRPENNMVRSKNEPENNMVRSKNGPKNNIVGSKNGSENNRISSKNGAENNTIRSKNGPDEVVASSRKGPDEVVVASLKEKETTEKHCLQKPNNSDRFLGQKSVSSRRSQSPDRYHGALENRYHDPTEDRFIDIWEDRFTGSSDADTAEPDGCCDRKKLALMRVKDRVEMLEISENLRAEFQTGRQDWRHLLLSPSTENRNHQSERMYDEMGNAGDNKTVGDQHDGDDEDDEAEEGEEKCSSIDSACYWSEGDACEQLLLTESDQELAAAENDAMVSKEIHHPIPDTPGPVEVIIHAEPHRSRMTARIPIPVTPVQLPARAELHRSRMTAPSVATPEERRSCVALFQLVKDALTGLNRSLRSNDIGAHRMHDQRAIIAFIVFLIALLLVFVMAECPTGRQH